MAWFGRESAREQQRAERLAAWARAQNTSALLSVPLGLLAVVDAITMVLGLAAGIAAVVLGVVGWRGAPAGRGLAAVGIMLGLLGVALSVAVALLLRVDG